MESNRDQLHAAGGAFLAGQLQREQSTPTSATNQKPKREPRQVLDLREERDLSNWMHAREPKWGETAVDIFDQARAALPQIAKLNVDHIKTRLKYWDDSLPKATPPVRELTLYERLDRAEKGLAIFARFVIYHGAEITAPDRAWLADFLTETGL